MRSVLQVVFVSFAHSNQPVHEISIWNTSSLDKEGCPKIGTWPGAPHSTRVDVHGQITPFRNVTDPQDQYARKKNQKSKAEDATTLR